MANLEDKRYWIWLSLIKGLGAKRKGMLIDKFKDPSVIYNLKEKDFLNIKGIGEETIKNLLDEKIKQNLGKHINFMAKNDIDIISINDENYPQILKHIYDPPISLYIRGNHKILNTKSIAIVGCRELSDYGKKASKYFAYNLAKRNLTVISGLAKGIDSYAHIGTLCAKGNTIAVVGNGLDTIYPIENVYLANEILKNNGAIISEYPLGTKPEKMNFPARNRIISGLSKGVLVVEAKEKSGTLLTVDFAIEQGRDVFVVPGNINSLNSVGTNDLIKQGAKPVTNYMDIDI